MLKAALIGCGGIAERHAAGFTIPGRCEVRAGADISDTNLQRTCDVAGIPNRYLDHRQLLEREKPDVVAICTWSGTHAEITHDCVDAGVKGILCEKPMAVSPAECDAMIEKCERAGVALGVGHHLRFQGPVAAARRAVEEGRLGSIMLARSTSRDGLANNASHWVDLARFLLGDPEPTWAFGQVERLTDRYERGEMAEDCAVGAIGFSTGERLVVESDLSSEQAWFLLVGEKAVLRVQGRVAAVTCSIGGAAELPSVETPSQHGAFLDWMEGGPLYASHARNGRWAVECLAGIAQSAWRRRRVEFPLKDRQAPLPAMVKEGALPVAVPGPYDIRGGGPRWR